MSAVFGSVFCLNCSVEKVQFLNSMKKSDRNEKISLDDENNSEAKLKVYLSNGESVQCQALLFGADNFSLFSIDQYVTK